MSYSDASRCNVTAIRDVASTKTFQLESTSVYALGLDVHRLARHSSCAALNMASRSAAASASVSQIQSKGSGQTCVTHPAFSNHDTYIVLSNRLIVYAPLRAPSNFKAVEHSDDDSDSENSSDDAMEPPSHEAILERGYTESLNLGRSYGRTSGWAAEQGVRELIQNCWDGSLQNKHYRVKRTSSSSHPTDDTPLPRVVESSKETTRTIKGQRVTEHAIIFDAYSMSHKAGGTEKKGHLFQIHFSPDKKVLKPINFDVALDRDILVMGNTSKTFDVNKEVKTIGGHGEGLKIGQFCTLDRLLLFFSLAATLIHF